MLFFAIAEGGKVTSMTNGAFVDMHRLNSASSVALALKGLLKKDFITMGKNVYSVYDRFFTLWLRSKGII